MCSAKAMSKDGFAHLWSGARATYGATKGKICYEVTGKSFSEALVLASTKPKYDKRLFIDLQVQYMKIGSSEHVQNILHVYINCSECQNKNKKQFMYTKCSELVVFMY